MSEIVIDPRFMERKNRAFTDRQMTYEANRGKIVEDLERTIELLAVTKFNSDEQLKDLCIQLTEILLLQFGNLNFYTPFPDSFFEGVSQLKTSVSFLVACANDEKCMEFVQLCEESPYLPNQLTNEIGNN